MLRDLTFLRHANAVKGSPDKDRPLSDKGIVQATDRRNALRHPSFGMVFASPALRTMRTAAIVSQRPVEKIVDIESFYPDPAEPVGAEIDKYFNDPELGYASVDAYLKKGATVIIDHGLLAWSNLNLVMRVAAEPNILVAGHAVMLPAMGMAACAGKPKFVEALRLANLGETEGFRLTLDGYEMVALEMIR